MSVRLRILFVCEHCRACGRFQNSLEREGCQLQVAAGTEHAVRTLLSTSRLDAVLIHQDDLIRGSTIGWGLKLIRPSMPVLLLTASWPSNGALPLGIDALCYTAALNRRVAHDITRFLRKLLADAPHRMLDQPRLDSRFLPRISNHLN